MTDASATGTTRVRVIRPARGAARDVFGELWRYRELLGFLAWRDVSVRYRQTLIGGTWAILQPCLQMILFTILFGRLAKVPTDGSAYPIFSYVALLPWTLFANGVTQSSNSVVNEAHILTKVYFPRAVLPVASIVSGLIDFLIAFLVLIVLFVTYGVSLRWQVGFLPLFVVLACMTSLGVGLWLAALNVRFRDVRHVVPFLVQMWLFVSPVIYSSSAIPDRWRPVYYLNPMACVIDGFRWSLLGTTELRPEDASTSIVVALALLIGGAAFFARAESSFADIV